MEENSNSGKPDKSDHMNTIKTLTSHEISLLKSMKDENSLEELIKNTGLKEIQVKRAIQWLYNKNLIEYENISHKTVELGENGKLYKKKGLPEKRFLDILEKEFRSVKELEKKADLEKGEINIVIGTLKRKGAIEINKDKDLQVKLTDFGKTFREKTTPEEKFLEKKFPIPLDDIKDLDKLAYDNLSKRKNIVFLDEKKSMNISITKKGKQIKPLLQNIKVSDVEDKLTSSMLKDGSWKNKKFRHFDVSSDLPKIKGGCKHFVNQAIEYMKEIWVELGFQEMEGDCCQTSFWDLDALFVPQDHPARQMQDSFFIKDHQGEGILKGNLPDIKDNIKKVHENGGDTGSLGWGGKWSEDFSKEVMLRTHTTALSAQYINKKLERDKNGKIKPAKFFSVNKTFRNEALDWKHLFEFNQVEGIVVDPDANFSDLLGYLEIFFKKMGYAGIRVRPAHFPYTEPSVEVEVYIPDKKEWIELGGAGIFRPEVTKPLIGEEVPVLAWGLGMERIILEYFDIKDIRDLYKNDEKQLNQLKSWVKFGE
ncbi:MAG: phenylalanine--tRNA ligase subunit alpha [Nanobdellota archaeon]